MKPGRAATHGDLYEVLIDDILWTGRFCIQHLAEVYRNDTECDYADEWAESEMRCAVRDVLIVGVSDDQ
jgi:hypothetical protein